MLSFDTGGPDGHQQAEVKICKALGEDLSQQESGDSHSGLGKGQANDAGIAGGREIRAGRQPLALKAGSDH